MSGFWVARWGFLPSPTNLKTRNRVIRRKSAPTCSEASELQGRGKGGVREKGPYHGDRSNRSWLEYSRERKVPVASREWYAKSLTRVSPESSLIVAYARKKRGFEDPYGRETVEKNARESSIPSPSVHECLVRKGKKKGGRPSTAEGTRQWIFGVGARTGRICGVQCADNRDR